MKTPEEIKKGLGYCEPINIAQGCRDCPYIKDSICCDNRNRDALAYIQQLESRLAQAERERDAAVSDLKTFTDKYTRCALCDKKKCIGCNNNSNWQWRGVCPENEKEDAT